MSITTYANVGATTVRLNLTSPREAHEARAQQSCCDMIDSSREADAQANRRDLSQAGDTILDTPTVADQLRGQPGALDRFER